MSTAFSPKNDRFDVYSAELAAHAEVTAQTIITKAIAAGANITLTTDAATGVTTIAAAASSGVKYTSSDTAPTAPALGDEWFDTTTSALYKRVNDGGGAGAVWMEIG